MASLLVSPVRQGHQFVGWHAHRLQLHCLDGIYAYGTVPLARSLLFQTATLSTKLQLIQHRNSAAVVTT
jgi:hypothetical protein